jgi:hypothetical protein
MKKILFVIQLLQLIPFNPGWSQVNLFIPNDFIVSYGVVVHPDSLILDVKPIDVYPNYFRDIITEKLVNNGLPIFQPFYSVDYLYAPCFTPTPMTHEDWMNSLIVSINVGQTTIDTLKYDWYDFYGIRFYEKWNIDPTKLIFDKQVLSIIPVLSGNFFGNQRLKGMCLIPFNYSEKELKNLRSKAVLSKRIKYMVPLFDERNKLDGPFYNSIVHNRLINFLFDNIRNSRLTACDYNSNKMLTAKEAMDRLKIAEKVNSINSLPFADKDTFKVVVQNCSSKSIEDLIFIEDWYVTKEPFMIFKEVIGIAPVWHYSHISPDGEMSLRKTIPFAVIFDKDKMNW